jgi:hypothetical protein
MKNANRDVEKSTLRPVCLSDLDVIVELYKAGLPANRKTPTDPLFASDFGLPISLILNGNSVVGYTFVRIGADGKPEFICSLADTGTSSKITDHLLRPFHELVDSDMDLEKSMSKLIKWLNYCC